MPAFATFRRRFVVECSQQRVEGCIASQIAADGLYDIKNIVGHWPMLASRFAERYIQPFK